MEESTESTHPEPFEKESTTQGSFEKTAHTREIERDLTIEQPEQNLSQVFDGARKLYDTSMVQAIREVTVESDKLVAKLKEEADEIIRESREKASSEARQKSAIIIGETREKTAQIIKEVTERAITQLKNEFARATSEAVRRLESEKSTLLTLTKNIELIINETETNIRAGVEHLADLTTEIENRLQTTTEIPDRGAVPGSQQTALEDTGTSGYIEPPAKQDQKASGREAWVIPEEPPKAEGSEDGKSDARIRMHEGTALLSPETEEDIKESEDTEKWGISETKDVMLDAETWMSKGQALLDSGKNEEALDAFTKAIELDPKNTIAWRKKGTTLSTLGRNEEALKAFTKVIELDPKDVTAWHYKATALTNLRKKREAEGVQ